MRLFAAVAVPPHVRDAVDAAAAPLRASAPRLRWSDPAAWHLTIAFLGAVEPGHLQAVVEAVGGTAASARPFDLALTGRAESFPGVLWAGLEPSPALDALATDLRTRLAPLGYTEDRPFRPHLTLGRARDRRDRAVGRLAAIYDGPSVGWTVDRLTLWRSQLGGRAGARHTVIADRAFPPPGNAN